ncbi:uncharacterized protein BDZ83DRAFT_234305 [Colletotrichum acutatum]|uniref:Uncharacterized protein n=1 Tax=Glomerella acutata TaxID=27357 RepID=A0AAD8U6L5_GLOAC|nr:uncharacterized protein BDZ83DRAFT_234305 [Colletotrichum acutatum]KAK1703490.1 hypothetical protein BDZ83DRAFT_234305 [Colletotrichum acutatum]
MERMDHLISAYLLSVYKLGLSVVRVLFSGRQKNSQSQIDPIRCKRPQRTRRYTVCLPPGLRSFRFAFFYLARRVPPGLFGIPTGRELGEIKHEQGGRGNYSLLHWMQKRGQAFPGWRAAPRLRIGVLILVDSFWTFVCPTRLNSAFFFPNILTWLGLLSRSNPRPWRTVDCYRLNKPRLEPARRLSTCLTLLSPPVVACDYISHHAHSKPRPMVVNLLGSSTHAPFPHPLFPVPWIPARVEARARVP